MVPPIDLFGVLNCTRSPQYNVFNAASALRTPNKGLWSHIDLLPLESLKRWHPMVLSSLIPIIQEPSCYYLHSSRSSSSFILESFLRIHPSEQWTVEGFVAAKMGKKRDKRRVNSFSFLTFFFKELNREMSSRYGRPSVSKHSLYALRFYRVIVAQCKSLFYCLRT